MQVSALLQELRNAGSKDIDYQGSTEAEFVGLAVRARQSTAEGRCFFLVDDHWPKYWRKATTWSQESAPRKIRAARAHGISCIVVSRDILTPEVERELEGCNVFYVDNSYRFYFAVGYQIRRLNMDCNLTLITGSVGKTTTTGMIAHAIRHLNQSVFVTHGSQNVPVAVIRNVSQTEGYDHAVIEASHGACQAFTRLKDSVDANVAVVTSIAEAHLDVLKTLENVAKVKSAVFDGPPPAGTAVICLDAPYSDILVRRAVQAGRQLVTYGESPLATIRLVDYVPDTRRATVEIGRERITYHLGIDGKHIAINSLAVIGVLRAYGMKNWREGVESLVDFVPVSGRGERLTMDIAPGLRISLINEAYNANPASIRASLESLSSRNSDDGGRKIAILGDILELGEQSEAAHRGLADPVASADLDEIILFGDEMRVLHEELTRRRIECHHFSDVDEMANALPSLLKDGDEVLAKASHSMGLNAWVSKRTSEKE